MALGDNIDIPTWESFIQAEYLYTEPKCPLCKAKREDEESKQKGKAKREDEESKQKGKAKRGEESTHKACNNYFCVACKVGSLCPEEFNAGGSHFSHANKLQVRKLSHDYIVQCEDVQTFLDTSLVQCYLGNNKPSLYLRTKTNDKDDSNNRRYCHGCKRYMTLPKTKDLILVLDSEEKTTFCSIECLLKYHKAGQQPVVRNVDPIINVPVKRRRRCFTSAINLAARDDGNPAAGPACKRTSRKLAKPNRSPLYDNTPTWLLEAESVVARRDAEMAAGTSGDPTLPVPPPAQAASPLAAGSDLARDP